MINRQKLIAQIHIGKAQLKMDDDTYRAFLMNAVNKGSCATMSILELYMVIDNLKKRGFKARAGKLSNGKRKMPPSSDYTRSNIIKKIRAKWLEMHATGIIRDSSENALNKYVAKVAKNKDGYSIPFVSWLDNEQATRVLEQLKKWQQRERGAN